jgi:hypothetical protein
MALSMFMRFGKLRTVGVVKINSMHVNSIKGNFIFDLPIKAPVTGKHRNHIELGKSRDFEPTHNTGLHILAHRGMFLQFKNFINMILAQSAGRLGRRI